MDFPKRADLCRTTAKTDRVVIKIEESQSDYIGRQSLRQFATMRRVQLDAMLCQLRLQILSCTAVLAIHRRFHNHPPRSFIRCLRNLHVDIAVFAIQADFLHKSDSNMKYLKLNSSPRRIERTRVVLRPTVNRVDCDFFGGHGGDGHMFLAVTVFNTLVKGSALAKISGLEWAEILAQIVYTCAGESETGGKRETCKGNASTHRRSTYGHHRAHSMLNFLFMQDWWFMQSRPAAKSSRQDQSLL
jgi:hypothetical protein